MVLTDEERLRVFSSNGSQLNQTDEKFSGSAIGIAEQTQMPGMGKDNILIPSKYFVPVRMIPSDLEQDGTWELLVNKPISVSAQFFENYRFFLRVKSNPCIGTAWASAFSGRPAASRVPLWTSRWLTRTTTAPRILWSA